MSRLLAIGCVGIVLGAIVSSACSSTSTGDIEAILDSGPRVIDITATSARIAAKTKIDLVCGVAFGTTEEYGRLATDDDMAGTGHADHAPLLTGLQPDTEYHFTFGGLGPDGTVYNYTDLTFRTKAQSPSATLGPSGVNLALLSEGASVADTSSNFGGADQSEPWGGSKAIDGDPGTQWSSNGDGNDAWIEIELPTETKITGLGLWSRTMGSSAQISSFRIVSGAGEVRGPFEVKDAASVQYFETDITARRVRFEVIESSGGNTGAVEIEIYGSPSR